MRDCNQQLNGLTPSYLKDDTSVFFYYHFLCVYMEIWIWTTDNILESNKALLMWATLRDCPHLQVTCILGNTLYALQDELL